MNRARLAAGLTAATGVLVVAAAAGASVYAYRHTRPPQAPASSPPLHARLSAKTYLGVFKAGDTASYRPVQRFAQAVGTRPNIILYYNGWGGQFETLFANRAARHGAIPFVQLLPEGVAMASIAAGRSDSYLRTYAQAVRAFGGPVILSFAPEANGWWYDWGWSHTPPRLWRAAWRHVVTVFRRQGAQNVTWLWTITHSSIHTGPLHYYWPGARYITWVGIDGYYYTRDATFASVFGPKIKQVRRLTHAPILLSETGIGQVAGQARKLPSLFAGIKAYHLLGLVWFDVAQHGGPYHQHWQLEGHPAALAAFRRGLRSLREARHRPP